MRLGLLCSLFLLTSTPTIAQQADLVAKTEARTPEEERKLLKLPPGFEIQLVASEPDIYKPMNIAFDPMGRLWVTSSIEYPYAASDPSKARDIVTILDKIDPITGKPGSITRYESNLNIPIGLLPMHDHSLVFHIGQILKLSGPPGAVDKKTLIAGYGARDTHGMTNAFNYHIDGWVYACHGYANDSKIKGTDGSTLHMQSGNVYRFKPDGSKLEQVTFGQVNPFGLAFDPLGQLFSSDCHTRPVMLLMPGACYDSFGKPHDGLGYAPEICKHDHGSTGIAGITYYTGSQFPKEYKDRLFIGNVVTSRVNQDKVEHVGAGVKAVELPDFITSDDPWFRPVDIKMGPDGALYIADFYNKIIGHYEVPLTHPGRDRHRGRIWRVVYKGENAKPHTMPHGGDFTSISVAKLIDCLEDGNMTTSTFACHEIVRRGLEAGKQLRTELQTRKELLTPAALYVLERLALIDDDWLRKNWNALNVPSRAAMIRILGERTTWNEFIGLALFMKDAIVRRAAAEAIARHPDPVRIGTLTTALLQPDVDPYLRHALRIALRNCMKFESAWKHNYFLSFSPPQIEAMADVVLGVKSPQSAEFLLRILTDKPQLINHPWTKYLARYLPTEKVSDITGFIDAAKQQHAIEKIHCLEPIAMGLEERGSPMPDRLKTWAVANITALWSIAEPKLDVSLLTWTGKLQLKQFTPAIAKALANKNQKGELRQLAAKALLELDAEQLETVTSYLSSPEESADVKQRLIDLLSAMPSDKVRQKLLPFFATSPEAIQTRLALGLAGSKDGAELVLQQLETGKASPRILLQPTLQQKLKAIPNTNFAGRISKLTQNLPKTDEKLLAVMKKLQKEHAGFKSDTSAGKQLFEKQCAICHQLGNQGAKIGPQLDGIGQRGLDRLLEDMLDSQRNVDQAFRSSILELKDGRVMTGLLLREEGEVIILADDKGKEVRVAKSQVEEKKLSQLSPMPSNFHEQMTEADLHHLLAYLLSQRVK